MTESAIRVLNADAADAARDAASRRDWEPVIGPLRAGQTLFFPDQQVRDNDVKYLQLVFSRKRREWQQKLHTRKTTVDGVAGRIFWATPQE